MIKVHIDLTRGTLDNTNDLDAVVITSATALIRGAEDVPLICGDRITVHGDVIRRGVIIANIL